MKFRKAATQLDGVPHISQLSARILYDFILTWRPARCLELGFAHGASSGYIAAALDELGGGHLDSVDIDVSKDFEPTIESTLQDLSLTDYVAIHREANSYNWFLKKKIESLSEDSACEPYYDFIFIDGSKNWTIDGMAFFLADKLLRPDGWILFDDYAWRYADALQRNKEAADGVTIRNLSQDQIDEPNVASIFHLLVAQHPAYSNFTVQDQTWAWAQKNANGHKNIANTRKSRLGSRMSYLNARLG